MKARKDDFIEAFRLAELPSRCRWCNRAIALHREDWALRKLRSMVWIICGDCGANGNANAYQQRI